MTKYLILILLLLPSAANALTRTENRLENVRACISRVPETGAGMLVHFETYDDVGMTRQVINKDVWPLLTAAQQGQIKTILGRIYDLLYQSEAIPTPTPTPMPTASPVPTPTP